MQAILRSNARRQRIGRATNLRRNFCNATETLSMIGTGVEGEEKGEEEEGEEEGEEEEEGEGVTEDADGSGIRLVVMSPTPLFESESSLQ